MRVRYDPEADALYIRLSEKAYFESDEVRPGVIFDYDRDRRIVGIEVLDARKNFSESVLRSIKPLPSKSRTMSS